MANENFDHINLTAIFDELELLCKCTTSNVYTVVKLTGFLSEMEMQNGD